jgi:hypothetical protein
MILSIVKKIAIGLALLTALVYAADYVSIHVPIPAGRAQFGTLQVKPFYAVPMKDGKTEYMYEDVQTETCSHSLFPQYGHSPCWRESGKPEKQLKLP